MRQASPAARELARRLLASETGEGRGAEARLAAAERAADQLRLHLTKAVSPGGFQALLARALVLARAEFPWLAAVEAGPGGTLAGLREAAPGPDRAAAVEGIAAVLAHLLELLVRLIGLDLTRRLLGEVWPALSREDSEFEEASG